MWGGVGEPGQRGAAGGGGGGGGPLRAGPLVGWLWRRGAPAWAVLPSSRPLEKKRQKINYSSANYFHVDESFSL